MLCAFLALGNITIPPPNIKRRIRAYFAVFEHMLEYGIFAA